MSKSFQTLLFSQSIANVADIFLRVILIANVFVLSGSVMATTMVPILIGLSGFVASFLVPLVTRNWSLNRIIFYTQAGKTLLLMCLTIFLVLMTTVSVTLLYLFVVGISILDGFASPVSHAILPFYTKDLGKANAALSVSSESIQLLGWGLGGLLFASLGFIPSLLITLVLFLLATVWTSRLPEVQIEKIEAETNRETLFRGWKLLGTKGRVRFLLGTNLLEILANSIWVSSILLVFVTSVLGETEAFWGYTNTAYSIGVLLGGGLILRISDCLVRKKWQSISYPLLLMACVTVATLQFPIPLLFLTANILIGFLSQFKEITESVLLQESVAESDLVYVYSVFEVVSTMAFTLFTYGMSWAVENFGITFVFMLSAVSLLLEALFVIGMRNRYFQAD